MLPRARRRQAAAAVMLLHALAIAACLATDVSASKRAVLGEIFSGDG